jgi:hypothetical protein
VRRRARVYWLFRCEPCNKRHHDDHPHRMHEVRLARRGLAQSGVQTSSSRHCRSTMRVGAFTLIRGEHRLTVCATHAVIVASVVQIASPRS